MSGLRCSAMRGTRLHGAHFWMRSLATAALAGPPPSYAIFKLGYDFPPQAARCGNALKPPTVIWFSIRCAHITVPKQYALLWGLQTPDKRLVSAVTTPDPRAYGRGPGNMSRCSALKVPGLSCYSLQSPAWGHRISSAGAHRGPSNWDRYGHWTQDRFARA